MIRAITGIYRLLLRQQLTTGRLVLIGSMSTLALIVGVAIGRGVEPGDRIEATIGFAWLFGIGLMVPIVSLVLASSALGDLVDDETLVYLWHRPAPRWYLAMAAWLASATVAIPATTVPLAASAAASSGGDTRTTLAVAVAAALTAVGYTGLFTLAGLVLRRALIWGLIYLFIWEFFVARIGGGAARLAITTYPSSVLAHLTDQEIPQAERALSTGVIVPIVVAVIAVALTSLRLDRTDVA